MKHKSEGAPWGCPLSPGARGFAHPEPIGVTPLDLALRVFSLNFWWGGGTQNIWDEVGWGDLGRKFDWSQNCPPNEELGLFCFFKHEIQLFKVLFSLKVVKFDTKMYLYFSNFQGRTSAGGRGTSLGPKTGDKCQMGDWQNFSWMGDPVPPGKNPGPSDRMAGVAFKVQTLKN